MHDVNDNLCEEDRKLLKSGDLSELLYADDTLIMSVSASSLQRFLKLVSEAGAAYGLELHLGKFQLLNVRCPGADVFSDAGLIDPQSNLLYLGSLISDDARVVDCRRGLASRMEISGNRPEYGVTHRWVVARSCRLWML